MENLAMETEGWDEIKYNTSHSQFINESIIVNTDLLQQYLNVLTVSGIFLYFYCL